MNILTECKGIEKLVVQAKVVEEKEKGEVVAKYPITVVKFQVRGTPGQFDDLLHAAAADHTINATLQTAQMSFQPAMAGK